MPIDSKTGEWDAPRNFDAMSDEEIIQELKLGLSTIYFMSPNPLIQKSWNMRFVFYALIRALETKPPPK